MDATVTLKQPLLRGERRPRVALVGRARTGKSTIFRAASSVAVRHERLAGAEHAYRQAMVMDPNRSEAVQALQRLYLDEMRDSGKAKLMVWRLMGRSWAV